MLLAAAAQAAKVAELKRKLGMADDDLVRINKRFEEAHGMFAEKKKDIYTLEMICHAESKLLSWLVHL